MSTILLTWNPARWPWNTYERDIERSRRGPVRTDHSVARKRGVARGDRAFLLRQGNLKGIIASGRIMSEPYPSKHWDGSGRLMNYCDVEYDAIVSPDDRLPTEVLQQLLPSTHWRPQQSGTEVRSPADQALEELWRDHLAQIGQVLSRAAPGSSPRPPRNAARRNGSALLGAAYRKAAEDLKSQARDPWIVDPDVVDRGLRGHRVTQNAAARHLRKLGIEPRSPRSDEPAFDLAWEAGGTTFVAEVKSLTSPNEEQQLRLGLGQVLRYRQLLTNAKKGVQACLIVERQPTDLSWIPLCRTLGVKLIWPSVFIGTSWRHRQRAP